MPSVTRLDHAYTLETITAPYIESGFMNHIMIAPMGSRTYEVSELKYGTEQAGGDAQGFVKVDGGVVTGFEALGERKSNAILDSYFPKPLYHDAPNGATSTEAVFSHDTDLPKRKQAQATIWSSWYTGLLQNYVQAKLGSPPCRYGLSDDGMGGFNSYPRLMIDGVKLEFWGKESHWIYLNQQSRPLNSTTENTTHLNRAPTYADGVEGRFWEDTTTKLWYGPFHNGSWGSAYPLSRSYWLVNISGSGQVKFTLLDTPKIACDPNAAGLPARKLHSLFLGNSKVSKTVKTFQVEAPKGNTLAYGWHSNEDGSEVRAVLDGAGNPDAGISLGVGYARHYSLKITGDVDGSPKSVKMTIVSEGKWGVSNDVHCLAFPELMLGKERYVAGLYNYVCDAPIYVTFHNGAFKEYRIKGANQFGTVGLGDETGEISLPADYTKCEVTSGDVYDLSPNGNGVHDSVGEFFPEYWWGSMMNWYGWMVGAEGGGAASPPEFSSGGDGYWQQRVVKVTVADWTETYEFRGERRDVCRPLLVVPFNDCEAVVNGKQAGVSYGSYNNSVHAIPGAPKTVSWQERFIPAGGPVGSWTDCGESVLADPDVVGTWFGGEATHHMANSFLSYFYVSGSSGGAGYDTTKQASVILKNETISLPNIADVYFQPSLGITGDPTDNPSYISESTGRSYTYSLGHGEGGHYDWPAGNPVGWA